MKNNIFNPFQDRKAHDLRNSLSSVFGYCLKNHDVTPLENLAEELLLNESSMLYKSYIDDRLNRFKRCLNIIEEKKITNPLEQSFIIWDEELFLNYMKFSKKSGWLLKGIITQLYRVLFKLRAFMF